MKFISQMFSSADETLQDETRLLLLWDGSLVPLHILCSNKESKSCLMVELYFCCFVHFGCVAFWLCWVFGKHCIKHRNHLIFWNGNFLKTHSFSRVLADSPETLRKLCISIKSPCQEIRWNFNILCKISDKYDNTTILHGFIW